MDAGAILVGKTNLDQFATGLTGTRSPFGMCRNPFDPKYICGGSSSGSASAMARGLVSFALGTDTAGSGRVPAAFNNIIGLKPTRGIISAAGVFPACRSLDCVSIFALTCEDAARVFHIARGYDPTDPFSRPESDLPARQFNPTQFRFGIPGGKLLKFFGNTAAEAKFHEAIQKLCTIGGEPITIDFAPFAAAARLLYEGPWVAERFAVLQDFLERSPEAVLPVTRQIISRGRDFSAADAFRGRYELAALCQEAAKQWEQVDVLMTPTTGTIYTIEEVLADPIGPNTNLGYYTNFVNLMDLCAVAVPNGFGPDGLPVGVSLIGRAGADDDLLALGDALHRATSRTLGATGCPIPPPSRALIEPSGWIKLAVVGAHLSGQPLNHQLTALGARLVRTCRTSSHYRLFALSGTTPPKPGLIRTSGGGGVPQEVEVWQMSAAAFGTFVAAIPPPLGIGTIQLEDGELVKSFLCEQYATTGARDISSFGGWRKFLASSKVPT
jgi:allophanate hydrolase